MIKALFDTNVIIDALSSRDSEYRDSQRLVLKAINKEIDGFISAKQITDIYYILRKYISSEELKRQFISDITESFTVLPFFFFFVPVCLHSSIPDFEDAVLEEAAHLYCIPYIITKNVKHFEKSRTIYFTPKDFINLIENGFN